MIKKIKNTLLWYYVIRFFIFPVYDLIWTNLINFKARFLYFLWFQRKRKYIDLKKNDGVLKVEESTIFNEISKNVLIACNKQILSAAENEINTYSDKNYNQSNVKPEVVDELILILVIKDFFGLIRLIILSF